MKKFISLIIALAIFLSLAITTFAEDTTEQVYLASSNVSLAFRDEQGKLITNMPAGDVFVVHNVDPRDSERVWVSWDGMQGSIIVREITRLNNNYTASTILDSSQKYAFTKRELNLRTTNSYEIIELIPAGSLVTIVDNDPYHSDRIVVNYYGTEGTILEDGVFLVNHANFILVDINTQTISMFKNGEIVLFSKVVTGQEFSHDTPRGFFSILSKRTDERLKGDDYDVQVDYWMPFYMKCGLHDASWRKAFGGNIYQKNGSHGCVNLKPAVAQFIYNNAYVGIPVIVC